MFRHQPTDLTTDRHLQLNMSCPAHTENIRVCNNTSKLTRSRPGYHGATVIDVTLLFRENKWKTTPLRHFSYNEEVSAATTRLPDLDHNFWIWIGSVR